MEGAKHHRLCHRLLRPSSAGDAPRPDTVVRVAADDGIVPGFPSGGAIVRVTADDDGIVPRRPGGGVVVRVVADDDGIVPGRPSRGVVVRVMADDDGVVPGRPEEGTTVIDVVLDICRG